jgi:hypothetical protein
VLRRLLLVVLVCLSAWALADRVAHAWPDTGPATRHLAVALPDLPEETDDSTATWEAPPPLGGGSTGSSWTVRAPIQCADLPGIANGAQTGCVGRAGVASSPTPSRPPHLLDIPLLI